MSLNAFKHAFKKQLLYSKNKRRPRQNLTKEERQGLNELTTNSEIVIQKADKGSAVVVMNTKDYLREGYRQLSHTNFYPTLVNLLMHISKTMYPKQNPTSETHKILSRRSIRSIPYQKGQS